ncbi:amidohydrolase family protein [Ensifer adhaerens]|uniref:amidohydrolase family protein n=1 Tax=Ensifer adhaerens TaxID=106592 RepID=UPI003CD02419
MTMGIALRGPELSTLEVCRRDWKVARELDLRPSVHIGNTPAALAMEPVKLLERCGLLVEGAHYVHATWLSADERRRIAESGGGVVITPTADSRLRFGIPAIHATIASGIRPALGVDVVTSTAGDMFGEMRAAHMLSRIHSQADQNVTATDVLRFATGDAATAIGLAHRVGSIERGKKADLILLNPDRSFLPLSVNVSTFVAFYAERQHVDTVIVGGHLLKRRGQLLGVNRHAIRARLRASLADLRERARAKKQP